MFRIPQSILLIFILLLVSCSLAKPDEQKEENSLSHFILEVGTEIDLLYDSGAEQTAKSIFMTGTYIINGSYFAKGSSGSLIPAGLFASGGQILTPIRLDDPNLSHVVFIYENGRSGIFSNKSISGMVLRDKIMEARFAFQAGPLVLSGGETMTFSGSWHASGPHERTLLGIDGSGNTFFFVFTNPLSLSDVAKNIRNDPRLQGKHLTVINLDGGPSTVFYDGKRGFRETEKLPLLLRVSSGKLLQSGGER